MIKNIIEENKKVEANKEKIDKLKQLFPNCFKSNGEFDISSLENELNKNIKISKEGYSLNFLGKNYAKLLSSLDTETVLVPDEENNKQEINKNSENIYISGDNIDALKHLVKSYSNKIKCIYIDPPYNTGSDGFVYNDNFNFDINKLISNLDITEDEAKRIYDMTNKKSNSHSAWLTFMYPRLHLARQLLTDDGVIFISIDDNEQANLKLLCDNIFGEENFIANICHKSRASISNDKIISVSHNYLLLYSKNITMIDEKRKMIGLNPKLENFNQEDEKGYYKLVPVDGPGGELKGNPYYDFMGITGYWRFSKEKMQAMFNEGLIVVNGKSIQQKYYLDKAKNSRQTTTTWWDDDMLTSSATSYLNSLMEGKIFNNPKSLNLLNRIFELFVFNDKNAIILDFFGGSSSTADALMRFNANDNGNRKCITVQIMEEVGYEGKKLGYKDIDEIGQERIRRAAKKIKEETNADIDYGFKHYTINQINSNTLDKLETFEPNYVISDGGIVDDFGKETVLTTWMIEDGYGLTDLYEEIQFDNYVSYKCKNTLYLLNPNITDLAIKQLIEKYEIDNDFNCNRIVLFGYSFTLTEMQTLKDNIKQVKNVKGINVDIITRY